MVGLSGNFYIEFKLPMDLEAVGVGLCQLEFPCCLLRMLNMSDLCLESFVLVFRNAPVPRLRAADVTQTLTPSLCRCVDMNHLLKTNKWVEQTFSAN